MKSLIVAAALALCAHTAAGREVLARKAAMITPDAAATRAGLAAMQSGGGAVDAALTSMFLLSVTHPDVVSPGGGGFLLYFDAETKGAWVLDFREAAPLSATRDMFLLQDGNVHPDASRTSARAVAVPGLLKGAEEAHRKFGRMTWPALLAPAIGAGRSDRDRADLQRAIAREQSLRGIERFTSTAALAKDAAALKKRDETYAAFLERVAKHGAAELYEGAVATKLLALLEKHGAAITRRELKNYAAVWRSPISSVVGAHEVISMPPPATAGVEVGEMLQLLARFDLKQSAQATALHLFAESARVAARDRDDFLGDPAMTRIPFRELFSREHADAKRNAIQPARASSEAVSTGADGHVVAAHVMAADERGNVAILSTALGDSTGSGLYFEEGGFFLNNAMHSFVSHRASGATESEANRISPSKRSLSSIAPVLLVRRGKPALAAVTSGPSSAAAVVQVLYRYAVHGDALQAAIAQPRAGWGSSGELKIDSSVSDDVVRSLESMGHRVTKGDGPAVVAMEFGDGLIRAASDPRAGGTAGGY